VKFQLETGAARYQINSYQRNQALVVNEQVYHSSLIISPNRLETWSAAAFETLTVADFEQVFAFKPRILLFGSGASFRFPAPALLAVLYQAEIGVEVMDTGAACRTYAVLTAEGREVAAALLL